MGRTGKTRRPGAKHSECRSCRQVGRKKRYSEDPGHVKGILSAQKNYHRLLREQVIQHYGMKCNCPGCSEDLFEFLTFDHVHGRSEEHKRQPHNGSGFSGHNLVRWIIDNNYPATIQILCYNCNCGKRTSKQCPHLDKLQDVSRNDLREPDDVFYL